MITYNGIGNKSILDDYETIEGKNAKDALKKYFNMEFKRVTGESTRYADIILIRGTFQNNTIRYEGNKTCYCIDSE